MRAAEPTPDIHVAEIPEGYRKEGMQWIILFDFIVRRDRPEDRTFELSVFGPKAILQHPGPRKRPKRLCYESRDLAHQAAAKDWGVEPEDWVIASGDMDYGSMPVTEIIVTQAALAGSRKWRKLDEPDVGGHCLICIHSFFPNGDYVPTTHEAEPEADERPLPPNWRYSQICERCYDRFIARDGVTEIMDQLLRGETPK